MGLTHRVAEIPFFPFVFVLVCRILRALYWVGRLTRFRKVSFSLCDEFAEGCAVGSHTLGEWFAV